MYGGDRRLFGVPDEITDITRSSGGKDLYIGSPVLATGKVPGVFDSVPGVPEGPREGPTTPGGHMGLRGVAPALSGLGKPAP